MTCGRCGRPSALKRARNSWLRCPNPLRMLTGTVSRRYSLKLWCRSCIQSARYGCAYRCAFRDIDSKSQTAQAEVNHPEWAKAMEVIYPRARDMMAKPRYWHVAYPLAVTALCVAPQEFFLRNWVACFEAGLGKLKVSLSSMPTKMISHL